MKLRKPTVKLVDQDGNAFAILGRVRQALKEAGQEDKVSEYMQEATNGDYNHLIQVTMEYVEVI